MRWIAVGLAAVVLLPVVVLGAALDTPPLDTSPLGRGPGGGVGLAEALDDIPAVYMSLYRQAAARFGIPVAVLAAVGKVECDHGRNPACARPNAAGARGPMQFLPATFAAYAWASGNPNPSPYDPRDAVFAAAAYLAASGLAANPWAAIFAYNHARSYVALVISWALVYGWAPPDAQLLADAVLAHPHLGLRAKAAGDVAAGRVDARILSVLLMVATAHRLGSIGPLITGHSRYVAGSRRVSNHILGRAVDIPIVDGQPVSAANTAALAVVRTVLALPDRVRPTEIGCPWSLETNGIRTFTDAAHQDHLHLGYDHATT
jgi:hypothetical protein